MIATRFNVVLKAIVLGFSRMVLLLKLHLVQKGDLDVHTQFQSAENRTFGLQTARDDDLLPEG